MNKVMTTKRAKRRKLPPEIVAERQAIMGALHSVVHMLGTIVGPHVEVVLHHLSTPGAPVTAPVDGPAAHTLVGGDATVTGDNRSVRSATTVFRDGGGEPFAALSLNADMSQFEMAHAWLGQLLQPLQPVAAAVDKPEVDVLIQEIISDAVRRTRKPLAMMSKAEKVSAVRAMQQRGLFSAKGGVEHAAKALGVSRYTIYNYLDALRQEGGLAD